MMRQKASTQDYGRKPYLHQAVDETVGTTNNYREMMKSLTLAEVQRKKEEKQSEFEKPYRRGMDYQEMQNLHPDNFNTPYSRQQFPPTGGEGGDGGDGGGGAEVTACDMVWSNCLQQVCGNNTGCSGAGVVKQMWNCAGDCSKDHKEILSCLLYNSLCFCLVCYSHGGVDCSQDWSECDEAICDTGELCPPFELPGSDSCPAYLCPTAEICASDIVGGYAIGKCVYVPCEGCGTKNVCVTDVCGNTVCKEVRMSDGAWYQTSNNDYCIGAIPLNSCETITGGTKIYTNCACRCPSTVPSCPSCPCTNNLCNPWCVYPTDPMLNVTKSVITYEWRC